ncbi:MAG: hypothetical protein VZQ55_07365 [Ruminococcus sp.]|nr:hypothetical protein [Ruminococcus sp.]
MSNYSTPEFEIINYTNNDALETSGDNTVVSKGEYDGLTPIG